MDSSATSQTDARLQKQYKQYGYNYPSFRRVMLAAVKDGIYHPQLPSLRRMDMDTATHRLSDEHCRTSTTFGPREFQHLPSHPPERENVSAPSLPQITTTFPPVGAHTAPSKKRYAFSYSKDDLLGYLANPVDYKIPVYDPKYYRFCGYAIRYIKPEVEPPCHFTLQQEPKLDQYGQKPIPANIYSRYRDTLPLYSRNVAVEDWR